MKLTLSRFRNSSHRNLKLETLENEDYDLECRVTLIIPTPLPGVLSNTCNCFRITNEISGALYIYPWAHDLEVHPCICLHSR